MNRRETTRALSQLVERDLLHRGVPFAREVAFFHNDSRAAYRPDYVSVSARWGGMASLSDIACATVTVWEVKSCKADLTSGHGMNAVGDVNRVVMPFKVFRQCVEAEQWSLWRGFAVSYPVPKGFREQEKEGKFNLDPLFAWNGEVDGWELFHLEPPCDNWSRSLPLEQVLWSMAYAGIHRGTPAEQRLAIEEEA